MSLTALVFLVVYAGGLALAFVNPFWGLSAYFWAFYNHPPSRWWGGELPDLRWSLIAGSVTLVALIVRSVIDQQAPRQGTDSSLPFAGEREHEQGRMGPAPASLSASGRPNWGLWLLAAFAAWTWAQWPWAQDPATHVEGCVLFTKYVILLLLIDRLITSEGRLELFSWTHVGGCFLWGWIAYSSNVSGRAEINVGPGVADANTLGFHLVTGLAFAGLMVVGLGGMRRLLVVGLIPFILNGIILSASRGAAVSMVVAGTGALLFAPRARRWTVWAAGVLGVVLFLELAGSEVFWQRMGTLQLPAAEADMEGSAYSRIVIARANWEMFLDHPFGAGYRGNVILSPSYMDAQWLSENGFRAAHNTFLAVLVDGGIPGILIFSAMLVWAGTRLVAMRRLDKQGLLSSFGAYRAALAGGFAAYVVAGQFTNFVTAEVGVWMLGLVAPLDRLCSRSQSGRERNPVEPAMSRGYQVAFTAPSRRAGRRRAPALP